MAEAFFQATAWTMDTPKPYGAFHLVLTVLGVSLSIFLSLLDLHYTCIRAAEQIKSDFL